MPPPTYPAKGSSSNNSPNGSSRNNGSSVSFFDDSFAPSAPSPSPPAAAAAAASPPNTSNTTATNTATTTASSPSSPSGNSLSSQQRQQRRPCSQPAVARIPRNSLRGNRPRQVIGIKPSQTQSQNSQASPQPTALLPTISASTVGSEAEDLFARHETRKGSNTTAAAAAAAASSSSNNSVTQIQQLLQDSDNDDAIEQEQQASTPPRKNNGKKTIGTSPTAGPPSASATNTNTAAAAGHGRSLSLPLALSHRIQNLNQQNNANNNINTMVETTDDESSASASTSRLSVRSRQSTVYTTTTTENMMYNTTPPTRTSSNNSNSSSNSNGNSKKNQMRHSIATMQRTNNNTNNHTITDDDNKSVSSFRSYGSYSRLHHRSRAHLDPSLGFLHESVLEAAKLDHLNSSTHHTSATRNTASRKKSAAVSSYLYGGAGAATAVVAVGATAGAVGATTATTSASTLPAHSSPQAPESSPEKSSPSKLEKGGKDSDDDDDTDTADLKKNEVEVFGDELDDDVLLHLTRSTGAACWERSGWMLLCALLLGFWGGLIPYLIVRFGQSDDQSSLLDVGDEIYPPTTSPTIEMIPWTSAPSLSPGTRRPTPSPTGLYNNQGLLDILGSSSGTVVSPSSNTTNTSTTLAPASAIDGADNETLVLVPTANNETLVPVNISTISPTATSPTNTSSFVPYATPQSPAPTISMPSPPPPPPLSNTTGTNNLPSSAPTFQAWGQPDVVFPEYTLAAFNNPSSPQSKAFSWMLRDPNFGSYVPNRIRQRFALATLYYATNGDDWTVQQQVDQQGRQAEGDGAGNTSNIDNNIIDGRGGLLPWLSYVGHECDWYYQTKAPLESRTTAMLQLYSSNPTGVQVCENEVQGDIVLRSYRSLWLENARLQGTLPPELAMLTGLQHIGLTNNDLFGTLPPAWFWDDKATTTTWQTSLEQLHLQNNTVTGSVPSEIGLASNLVKLDLQQNQFRAKIPSEIGLLSNLQHLLWNDNSFSGGIPTEIGGMESLTACSWTSNQLSGTLPVEIVRCQSLQEFYVGDNRMTGSIPWEIGLLRASLLDLHLYSNKFKQNIPTRLGLLTKLRWLHLGDNELTGKLPSELGQLPELQLLQVENNALQGAFPSKSLATLEKVSRVWLNGNPDLNGTTPLSWCGEAPSASSVRIVDIKVDCDDQVLCICRQGCSCV